MTDENQQPQAADQKLVPFGTRLKSAREALGLDCKDAAAQLRLNEKIILMMEKDRYPTDLPATFIRGYIRAYAKLLQIPEHEVRKAIEPIKTVEAQTEPPLIKPTLAMPTVVTTGNYFVQLFSYLILFTLIGLAGTWWYSHKNALTSVKEETSAVNPAPNNTTTTPVSTPSVPVTEPTISPTTAPNTTQPISTPGKVPPSNSPSATSGSNAGTNAKTAAPAKPTSDTTNDDAGDESDNNTQTNDDNNAE